MRPRRSAWHAAWLLTLGATATAQDMPQEPAPSGAQRIEIRARNNDDTELRRRESVAKTVYGRDELDKYGDASVTDVLKRLPGVSLSGGNPRLRGLGGGYTQILINGEPAPPGFSLENLPPSQVERIEVTKGPTAEHSAQAVAGTLNIVLRAPPRQQVRELALRLGYSADRPTGGINGMWSDRLGVLDAALPLSGYQWAGDTRNNGLRDTRGADGQPQRLALQGLDHWSGGGVSLGPRVGWRPRERLSVDWQTFAQRNEFRSHGRTQTEVLAGAEPRSLDDRYTNAGHWQMARSGMQGVYRDESGARLEIKAGVQASESRFQTRSMGLDGGGTQAFERVTDGASSEQSRTTSGKFSLPLGETHTMATGWEFESRQRRESRDVVEDGVPLLQDFEREPFRARIRRTALWLQDEWDIAPRWSAYLGLRAEGIQTTSRSSRDELRARSEVVTPLLHLNYRFDPRSRDLLRASLTRAYKSPELGALMARPNLNLSNGSVNLPNTEASPDRLGNPALRPELSTNLDLVFERYLASGGVLSLGVFQRRIASLVRNRVSLETVPWSSVARWVSRPVNLEGALVRGLEFEVKGRAGDLMAGLGLPAELNLRASASVYRSSVEGVPGPDNRLEQQQPWSLTLGFDHRVAGLPLGFGANLSYTPGYTTQLLANSVALQDRARTLDAYASWTISAAAAWRLSVNNAAPAEVFTSSRIVEAGGYVLRNDNLRRNRANWNLAANFKF